MLKGGGGKGAARSPQFLRPPLSGISGSAPVYSHANKAIVFVVVFLGSPRSASLAISNS